MWINKVYPDLQISPLNVHGSAKWYAQLVPESPQVSFCQTVQKKDLPLFKKALRANLEAIGRDSYMEYCVLFPIVDDKELHKIVQETRNNHLVHFFTTTIEDSKYHRNILAQISHGQTLLFFEAGDILSRRVGTYIWKELTDCPSDKVLTFSSFLRLPMLMATWRSTFFELGGFPESIHYNLQIEAMAFQAHRHGIPITALPLEYLIKQLKKPPIKLPFHTWSVAAKSFSFMPQDKIQRIR